MLLKIAYFPGIPMFDEGGLTMIYYIVVITGAATLARWFMKLIDKLEK